MLNPNYVLLEGSESVPLHDAVEIVGPADPEEIGQVTLELRRKNQPPPMNRKPLSRARLWDLFGARPEDAQAVLDFARANNLEAIEVSLGKRMVVLEGKMSDIEKMFPTTIHKGRMQGDTFNVREGSIQIPRQLKDRVLAVIGIDQRPRLQPHVSPILNTGAEGFFPRQIAEKYQFLQGDGSGAVAAFLEFGGGFSEADLMESRRQQGIEGLPTIRINRMGGVENTPGTTADHKEVALDVQVFSAVAPKATLVVYLSSPAMGEIIKTLAAAVHATITPTVISMSWGSPEDTWEPQHRKSINRYLQDAAILGTSFFASSGDTGGGAGSAVTEFPASSPHVVACGGTQMDPPGDFSRKEVVWDDQESQASGGGFSLTEPLPEYQRGVFSDPGHGKEFRGIPDVAGYACCKPGYKIVLNGKIVSTGGTSAVAPLYAGFIASIAGANLLCDLNRTFYGMKDAFNDIWEGNNNRLTPHGSTAVVGWDACTGLGRAQGDVVASRLKPLLSKRPWF